MKKGITEIRNYVRNYVGINQIFEFTKHEKEGIRDQKKIDKEMEKLDKQYHAVKDELFLGDAEKALELLRKFESDSSNNRFMTKPINWTEELEND